MKPLTLIAASALALTAAACGPKTPPARAALDCPAREGDLTRTSAAPDGKACTYTTSGGAEVTLQLVDVAGGVSATLAGIEKNLLADRAPAKPAAEVDKGLNAEIQAEVNEALAEARSDSGWGVSVDQSKDGKTTVVTGGDGKAAVVADENGTTRVNLPGVHIVANDADDTARVQIGPLNIDAGGAGATIRILRDVRLRGEALNPEKRGVRATLIYTGDDLPDGYRFVGYEAGGPKRGPITVAVVRARSGGPDSGDIYPDVKKLVRHNGGV
jgi:hypothetical protein